MNPQLHEQIASYIARITATNGLEPSANLFELGLLTSLDVLDIIVYLENSFGIELTDEDVDMQRFGTINGLVELVEKKSGETHPHVGA